MQASPEAKSEKPSAVIYKIASANNEAKQAKRERKKQSLIKNHVKEVWKNAYNPEICQQRCLKAYQQAVGILPYDPKNPECICSEHEKDLDTFESSCEDLDLWDESSDSGTDVEWEIHFSPPKQSCKP